jgi:multidrug efflux system membrane fusion protein
VTVSRQDDVRAVIADGVKAGERLVTSGFARLADKALVEVTSTEEVGLPPALPTIEPKRKGRGKGGAAKGGGAETDGADKAGTDKGGGKGKNQGTGTQGSGAKSSTAP